MVPFIRSCHKRINLRWEVSVGKAAWNSWTRLKESVELRCCLQLVSAIFRIHLKNPTWEILCLRQSSCLSKSTDSLTTAASPAKPRALQGSLSILSISRLLYSCFRQMLLDRWGGFSLGYSRRYGLLVSTRVGK